MHITDQYILNMISATSKEEMDREDEEKCITFIQTVASKFSTGKFVGPRQNTMPVDPKTPSFGVVDIRFKLPPEVRTK